MPDKTETEPQADPHASLPAGRASNGAYSADQIKVLEGLDAVRKRPGMYIGGTGLNALHHLVYEVVDNSIDEAMAGFATTVTVTIQADGSVAVVDDGRGIPVDPVRHEDPLLNGRPAVEIVLTKLHAGGKFGQEGSAYKVSGGLHGVGVSCVNALSEFCDVEVYRDGTVYGIGFTRGRTTTPLHEIGPIPASSVRRVGTTVTFRPDDTIFPETTFSYQTLATRLRELAYLNPGVTIRLIDERVGADGQLKSETFRAEHGLLEYIGHLMTGKSAVSTPVYLKREVPEQYLVCEVALQYHDGYNEVLLSFANNINNVDGGTHAQGFKVALTRTLNAYAKKSGIIKEKDPVPTGEDLREGLIAIVSVKLPDPTFNNQPKEKLLNPEVEGFVSQAVGEALDTWLEEHPAEAKRLCLKGVVAAQAREAARKARELTRRKSALDSGSMPHKLRDCKTKNIEESELFIVEGDSAGGSATQGRDVETQAILPLRGKLLNVERARIDKVLAFEEIRTLIQALRCGIGGEFDITRLRYGKVIIMTDADVDGSHIRTLLLTFFFRQMPELIRRGHVYVAQPPLYQIIRGKQSRYVLNGKALDDTLTELGLEGSSLLVRDVLSGEADASGRREPRLVRRVEGSDLRRAVRLLRRLGELVEIAERRGVKFPDLLAQRGRDPEGRGRLPTHKIARGAQTLWAWSERGALDVVSSHGWQLADALADAPPAGALIDARPGASGVAPTGPHTGSSGHTEAAGQPAVAWATVRELHENRELGSVFAELGSLGIDIDDYALTQEESVTGERLPTKYAWETAPRGRGVADAGASGASEQSSGPSKGPAEGRATADTGDDEPEQAAGGGRARAAASDARTVEVPGVAGILGCLHDIGRRGMDVKRFKGLGEMDAAQLWETTMDPIKRVLMRVQLDQAGEADALFSVLMGEQVEPRRKFIEDHALEVKNLDV